MDIHFSINRVEGNHFYWQQCTHLLWDGHIRTCTHRHTYTRIHTHACIQIQTYVYSSLLNTQSIGKTPARISLWCPTTQKLIKACFLIQPLEQEGGCQNCCQTLCSTSVYKSLLSNENKSRVLAYSNLMKYIFGRPTEKNLRRKV